MSDEQAVLVPIGRFARATGLTVKTLRHYADVGLLTPARVDASTGYRYYAISQLRLAAKILRLRGFEVPLAEMAALLRADDATMRRLLTAHRNALAARLAETSRSLDDLDRVISGQEDLAPTRATPRLAVERVPARTYVIARRRAPMEELTRVIPGLIGETADWLSVNGGWTGAPMARVGEPDDADVVELDVGWPVEEGVTPAPPLARVTHPAATAVVHRHVGRSEELHLTYAALERAMAVAGLTPTDVPRESYETNPAEEPDQSKWVTEIVWPVASPAA